MDEIQREFLDIVVQVRAHLEYRRALGMSFVEKSSGGGSRVAAPVVSMVDPVTTASH